MKFRRIVSFAVMLAMVMTSIMVITLPTAYAATVNTETKFTEDFEGYTVSSDYGASLTELTGHDWYMVDNTTVYTDPENDTPYTTFDKKIARIQNVDGSRCLQIVSAGAVAGNYKYGLGRYFPGAVTNGAANGIWEVDFDFKPVLSSGNPQFNFGFDTADGSASSETNAQHNIVSAYGTNFYLGHRDYMTIYNNSVTQGTLPFDSIGSATWYSVKAVINCNARYYSVEIRNRSTNALIARRSPISFAGNETVGFLKLSALGMGRAYAVYVDNVSIESVSRETTIYDETFDTYPNSGYAANEGIETGGSEPTAGDSYFEGYTPWRYIESIGKSYAIGNDSTLSSKVVRLGDQGSGGASGLIYMPYSEKLVDSDTQLLRGKLKVSFKIKPTAMTADVTVNAITASNQDIKSDTYRTLRLLVSNKKLYADSFAGRVNLASGWINVEQLYDVVDKTVTTTVTQSSTNTFTHTINGLTAVKAILFKVNGGSTVLMDDIKLEYVPYSEINITSVKVSGNDVSDVSDFAPGNAIIVNVNYINESDSTMPAKAIIAYFKDSRFLGYIDSDVVDVPVGYASRFFSFNNSDSRFYADADAIRVYLWDGFTRIKPYCDCKSYGNIE